MKKNDEVLVATMDAQNCLIVCLCDCDGSCDAPIDSFGIPLCNGDHNNDFLPKDKVSLKRLIEMDVKCVLYIEDKKTGNIVPLNHDKKDTIL